MEKTQDFKTQDARKSANRRGEGEIEYWGRTIPEGIEISEPDEDPDSGGMQIGEAQKGSDDLQAMVRHALAVPGSDVTEFTPEMPSLRLASQNHAKMFRSYIEASPDWHVFIEQGNRFASRRWSYGAELGTPCMVTFRSSTEMPVFKPAA